MKLHQLFYLSLSTLILFSCKGDKPVSVRSETITINGNKAPMLDIEIMQRPAETDNGNYIEVEAGQEVVLAYEGIEKDKVTWTQEGNLLGDGTSMSATYTWLDSGIKEVKAILSNGQERTVYVLVKQSEQATSTTLETDATPVTTTETVTNAKDKSSTETPSNSNSKPAPSTIKSDRDNDGVPDEKDECPDQKGLKKFNGCPDTDGDGIPDRLDGCPNEKGPKSNNGCPLPPPTSSTPSAEASFDPIRTGTAGISNTSCKGNKSITGTASMTITPQKMAELSYVKVAAEATCIANITITSNDGKKAVQLRNRQLNAGLINEINFQHLGYILKSGVVYTITISPADNDYKVSDLSECNSGNGSNEVMDVSYSGSKVLFGLVYKY